MTLNEAVKKHGINCRVRQSTWAVGRAFTIIKPAPDAKESWLGRENGQFITYHGEKGGWTLANR